MTLRLIDHGPYCGDVDGFVFIYINCADLWDIISVLHRPMRTVPETSCLDAANYMEIQDSDRKVQVGNWSWAPPGCFVGHKYDDYTHVYFNR